MDLTRNQLRAVHARRGPVQVSAQPGCGGLDVLAERVLHLVDTGTKPEEILVLASSTAIVDAVKVLIGRVPANAYTIHSFCSRTLHEHSIDAGLDPRFAVLGDGRRAMAARIADEVIAPHVDYLFSLGVPREDGDVLRDSLVAVHRRTRGRADIAPPADPEPFLHAFERCCMELISPTAMPGDWPDKVIGRIRGDLPTILITARRLMGTPDNWQALRKLRKFRGAFAPRSAFHELDQSLTAARDAFDAFVAAYLDRQASIVSGLLSDLAADLEVRYSAEKRRLGLLDYDDLLDRTADLLVAPDIALRFRERFRFVLTHIPDPTDAERRIVSAISRPDGAFSVGGPDGRSTIRLTENLSSREGILDFADYILDRVQGEEPGAGHRRATPIAEFTGSADPAVELMIVPRAFVRTPDGAERRRRTEARAIADKIMGITGQAHRTRRGVEGRPIAFRDIVILLHSPFDLRSYERALEARGIPVCAIGARGFYDAPEVQELIDLLQLPVVPGEGCCERPGRWKLDVGSWMLDVRSSTGGEDPETPAHYPSRLLPMRDGRRKYANILKLRDLLLESGLSLPDFRAQIEEYQRLGSSEPEAAIADPEGDVVRIMTINRASELHAPVVFLADLSRRLDPEPGLTAFDDDRGIAVRLADPLNGRPAESLSYQETAEAAQDRIMLREKDLFHKALTRAEERLILVGSTDLLGERKSTYRETHSWMGWIEKALNLGPGTPRGDMELEGCRVRVDFVEPRMSADPPPAIPFARDLREGLPIDVSPDAAEARRIAREAFERCLADEPPPPRRITRVSVSQALDYIECPFHYYQRHVIGVPEESAEPPDDPEEAEFTAADFGRLVHDLLSRIDFKADIPARIEELLSSVDDAALRAEARPLLERFAGSRWCAELAASDRALIEVPFEFTIAGKVFAGRMDAIYLGPDGWTVLDYKTGRAEDRERYELQVGIYAYAVRRLLGEMPRKGALVLLSIGEEWVQDTSDGACATSAAGKMDEVMSAIERGRFNPIPGRHCEWCSFSPSCRKE